MSDVDHYDFFVSYSRKDNANGWITNFVDELLAEHRKFAAGRDLTYFFDKHDIGAGADWQHTLNHGIAHSKLFVAFISPNYFASEWCRKEWRAWIDAEIAKHILTAGVRPVYIVEVPGLTDDKLSDHDFAKQIADFLKISEGDRVKLLAETPPVVKHLRRRQMTHNQPFCDVHSFYTEGVETLRRDDLRQVLSKLAQDLDHHAELLAKAEASDYTIHPYNKNFSGRLDELLQLREWLDKDDRTGVIHGVHGLGGIGKTELALTYAHAYASAYPGGRYLISCDGKASLSEAIRTQNDFILRFADKISDEQRKDPDEFYAAVLFHLGRRIEKLGHVLLLLDNVTDAALLSWEQTDVLTKLGPKLHLLATTRLSAPTTNNSVNETDDHKTTWISLDRLPDEDALDLLEKHRPFMNDEDREAARNIVKQLDGFTLAIELTAAYLAAKNSTSYAWMNKCLNIDALEKMANSDVKLRRHNHERRLSAILKPILEELQPAERRFMEYAALLPPDQVPLPWLKPLVTQDFPELLEEEHLEKPWDEVWQKLEKLSLISRTKEETAETLILRVHRLVQEIISRNMSNKKRVIYFEKLKSCAFEHLVSYTVSETSAYKAWEIKLLFDLTWIWLREEKQTGLIFAPHIMPLIFEYVSQDDAKKMAEYIIKSTGKNDIVEKLAFSSAKNIVFNSRLIFGDADSATKDLNLCFIDEFADTQIHNANKLYMKAVLEFQNKKHDLAISYCSAALELIDDKCVSELEILFDNNIMQKVVYPAVTRLKLEIFGLISSSYLDSGLPEKAIEVANGALRLLNDNVCLSSETIGKIYSNIARSYRDLGKKHECCDAFISAVKYHSAKKTEKNLYLADDCLEYAIILLKTDIDKSLELLITAKNKYPDDHTNLKLCEIVINAIKNNDIDTLNKVRVVVSNMFITQSNHGEKEDAKLPTQSIKYIAKVGRNDPCPCGTGKKHKKCCGF